MAWESRKGTKIRYYYTAQKVRGRVEKVCFGSGHRAAEMARQDAQARAARRRTSPRLAHSKLSWSPWSG